MTDKTLYQNKTEDKVVSNKKVDRPKGSYKKRISCLLFKYLKQVKSKAKRKKLLVKMSYLKRKNLTQIIQSREYTI